MNEDTNPLQSNHGESRRSNSKIIWAGVLLLVVLVSAFLAYKWPFTGVGILPLTNNQQDMIPSTDSNNVLEVFYYTTDNSSQQNAYYKIFKVSLNLEKPDINTHSFTIAGRYPSIITDSWKKNTILFISNSETQATVYSVDVSSQNSQPQILLTIPLDNNKDERVREARFVDNGTALAFITADGSGRVENSVLDIVSLKDQQKKENYLLSEKSPLYAGFGFLVATPDSKTIYLHETGGDGGLIWSQWYKVDRTTKAVRKLGKLPPIARGEDNPTASAFSPDRTRLAYADFSSAVDPADLNQEYRAGYYGQCLTFNANLLQKYASLGGTVMVQNLNTGATDEVFRNLSYQDNYCKNVGSRIISLRWLDNSHLAFETIDGVYALDVNTKQQQTLFTFERTISPGEQIRPSILFIQLPFIVFSDHSIVQTNTNKRLESVSREAQRGNFFVLE